MASGTASTYDVSGAVTGVDDAADPKSMRRTGAYVFTRTGDPNANDAGGVTADPDGYGANNPGVSCSALALCWLSRAVHIGGRGGMPAEEVVSCRVARSPPRSPREEEVVEEEV